MSSTQLLTQTYSDTYGGRLLREFEEAAERSMRRALDTPVITESQKAVAWAAFQLATLTERMLMSNKISLYVRDVLSGKRQPRPEVAPAVSVELQQMEDQAAQVQQQVEAERHEATAQLMDVVTELVAEQVQQQEEITPCEVVESVVVPMWVGTAERKALPSGLSWSGKQLPEVAQSVQVVRRGRARQVKVVGYFHAEGFIGVIVEFEGRVPSVLRTAPRSQCFFGSDLRQVAA